MASERDVRAGGAYVELGSDDKRLEKTLGDAKAKLDGFARQIGVIGAALSGLAAAVVLPIKRATDELAKHGDQIAKMAKRTGFATDTLSRFEHAAQLSGASIETMEAGLRAMQRSIFDAERGSIEIVESLKALSLVVEDLKGLSPEQQFTLIADRIGKIPDPSRKAAVAMKLLGRSGTQLIPMFNEGGDAIRSMMADADRLGVTLDAELAAKAEELTDANWRLSQAFRGIRYAVAEAVLPLIPLIDALTEAAIKVKDWVKANPAFVQAALKISAVIGALGAVLVGAAAAWFLLTSAAAPWIIIGAAVIGAVVALIEGFTELDTGVQTFADNFMVMGKTLTGHWEMVVNSWLKNWVGFKTTLMSGIEVLKSMWLGFMADLQDGFDWVMNKIGVLSDEAFQEGKQARADMLAKRADDQNAAVQQNMETGKATIDALEEVRKGLEFREQQRQKAINARKVERKEEDDDDSPLQIPGLPSREHGGVVGLFAGSRVGEQLGVTGGGVEKQQLDVSKQMRDMLGKIEGNTRNQTPRFA